LDCWIKASRQTSFGWLAALLALTLAACSSTSSTPPPPKVSTSTTTTPSVTPSPSDEPKPGGTLRIAGVTRSVVLDPASPISEQSAVAGTGTAASAADANRLLGRLVLRQLYSYTATDPTDTSDTAAKEQANATGPQPDLAAGAPKLTEGGRVATISLRTARWDVPSARRVTATDQLRALKRLCLPTVSSPVSGYFAETVVGYAAACRALAVKPPKTLAALDAVTISGLTTEGDTTLVIHLLRPASDLPDMLALPQTSPLPVESFTGLRVTNDAQRFVGDGPYRFVDPQDGETYALSRSPSWDPVDDPLRHAYVDHISVRGGFTAAQVLQRVTAGTADLSLDVPAAASAAAKPVQDGIIRTPAQSAVILAVGSRGANASRLAILRLRTVLAACVDTTTRKRVASALGTGVAEASSELLSGLSLVPAGQPSPEASASATPALTPNPTASTSAPTSPSATKAAGAGAPAATPTVRCAPTAGLSGVTLSLLVADSARLRAAAAVIATRFSAVGAHVVVKVADSQHFSGYARAGGWDLLLSVRPLRYPAPRALLAPLLDAGWGRSDAVALRRSASSFTRMLQATAARESDTSIELWERLRANLTTIASLLPLAELDSVYPRGPNVAHAPTVPTFSNADPTNVSLGSTRPTEPSRTATPTP
jgi:peptide/nickel transport system substrate-binding protein